MQHMWKVLSKLLSSTTGIHIHYFVLTLALWLEAQDSHTVCGKCRKGQVHYHLAALGHIAWVSKRRWTGDERVWARTFPSRALILGVSGGARGHVSLISSVARVRWLAGFPSVKQHGVGAVKMAAGGVFLLINPEGGVKEKHRRKVLQLP